MKANRAQKTSFAAEMVPEPLRWLHFLPRWSLLTGLAAIAIPILFLGGVGQQEADAALGAGYVELMQAVRSPALFRAAWTVDALVWLMLGGILIAIAGLLRQHSPVRARFIAVCGLIQIVGALGSFLRFDGIGDIAAQYALTSPEQQSALLDAYLNLGRIINAANHLAVLFQGIGYLLGSWGLLSLRGFPQWLAGWFALPGLLAVAQFVIFISGASYVFALNALGLVAGNIALNLTIAYTLWRPPALLASSLMTGTRENGYG